MADGGVNPGSFIKTTVPARLDRLPWARFHLMVVVALGITWVLDGLEVTIVGALSGVLQTEHTLHLSSEQIGSVASCYVAGAVAGRDTPRRLLDRVWVCRNRSALEQDRQGFLERAGACG
jgi:hypothetical protein